jgi:steroid 5-alpha reductase family enzyme
MAPVPVLDQYYLGIATLICLGWQFCFFIGASLSKSDKVTDFAYGTNFMGLAAILFACSQTFSARNILVFIFVAVWGLRLALYLFARVLKEGKDARFDGTRDRFFKFLAFWVAQFATVFAISIPFVILFSRPAAPPLQWQDGIGIALWCIGFTIETVADLQKFTFKNNPATKSQMCTVGLWRYSRHPNYFGEALCWWGIWSMFTAVIDANGNSLLYLTIFSPVYVGVILLFLSGVPTLEEPWDKKYGKDPSYRAYKLSVPPFLLFFPALYRSFPPIAKLAFCCEFPFYSKNFPSDAEAGVTASQGDLEQSWQKGELIHSYQK